jgi:hypothetical protein
MQMTDQIPSGTPFNAELLMGQQLNDANSTELIKVPEGEYTAVSEPISAESFKEFDIRRGERAGTKGLKLNVVWLINDDSGALKEMLGRAPKVTQGIMLDRGPQGLEMGKGKNVGLGRLREALGQNKTGIPWSFSMLGGQVAKIKVKHRIDGADTYVEVSDVTQA